MTEILDIKRFNNEEILTEVRRRMEGDYSKTTEPIQAEPVKIEQPESAFKVVVDYDKFKYHIERATSQYKPFGNVAQAHELSAAEDLFNAFERYINLPGSNDFKPSRDKRFLSYAGFATVRQECGGNMIPVREGFKSTDRETQALMKKRRATYLERVELNIERKKKGLELIEVGPKYEYADDVRNGQMAYGRGWIQTTWFENVNKLQDRIERDLGIKYDRRIVDDLDMLLEQPVCGDVLYWGVQSGYFNGSGRGVFYYLDKKDYLGARRTVNGLNKAAQVAGWYHDFYKAVNESVEILEVA